MDEIAIEVKNVSKKFSEVEVLHDISFSIKKGHVHALIGGNGAGKSTLINIISGVFPQTSGSVYVYGEKKDLKSPLDAQKAGISTIHQELNVAPDLDVVTNIHIGKEKKKTGVFLDKKGMEEETKKILQELDISIPVHERLGNLSVAEAKMVEIARTIYQNTSILIMDEPTASISDAEVSALHRLIKRLSSEGHTIIYISHKLDEIFDICDDVTVLRDGKHILTRSLEGFSYEDMVVAITNREDISETFPKRSGKPGENMKMEVKNLSWKNKVKDVSFSVKKGEILGIAGLIGSGRTEIMKAIIGEYEADSGTVVLDGKQLAIKSVPEACKHKIAYLPEDRKREGLFLEQSLANNIIVGNLDKVTENKFLKKKKMRSLCARYIKELNIVARFQEQKIGTLSGGNQQKAVIAKWLNTESEIYIFDEPTVGIDIGAKYEIRGLINRLADEGNTIIVISSEIEEVCGMADRVLVVRNGTIVKELTGNQINREEVYNYAAGVK